MPSNLVWTSRPPVQRHADGRREGSIVVALFFLSWVRAVGEDRRLVIYRLGNLAGFKGPGLVLVFTPFDRGVVLAIGDQGETVSGEWADLKGVSVPIRVEVPAPKGTLVRVVGFLIPCSYVSLLEVSASSPARRWWPRRKERCPGAPRAREEAPRGDFSEETR